MQNDKLKMLFFALVAAFAVAAAYAVTDLPVQDAASLHSLLAGIPATAA
jgi:hypothetical protein